MLDRDPVPLEGTSEVVAGELTSLVGIEDLRPAVAGKRLLKRFDTKLGAKRVRQPPCQHGAARPVHDHHQVEEALGHRDVGNAGTPDLVGPLDRQPTKEVRADLVSRRRLARVRALVDRDQPQQPHQPLHPLAIDDVTLGGQPRHHPARAVIGPSQILPVNQSHDRQILGADFGRLPVNRRARHLQQAASLRYRQYRVLALDHRTPLGSAHLPSFRAKKSFSTFNWPICR